MMPEFCDVSNGETQCDHIFAYSAFSSSYLCCVYVAGHEGKHQTGHIPGQQWDSGDEHEQWALRLQERFRERCLSVKNCVLVETGFSGEHELMCGECLSAERAEADATIAEADSLIERAIERERESWVAWLRRQQLHGYDRLPDKTSPASIREAVEIIVSMRNMHVNRWSAPAAPREGRAVMAKSKKRPKFRVGQVVVYSGGEYIDGQWCDPVSHYGTYEGFDDGRYHIKVGGRDLKVNKLRPLTARERWSHAR